MANIANNTYLFYGDKDELVTCHKMLNGIYEKVGSNESCVEPDLLRINPEWISYIDDINPGVDDRFYMTTESKWYGNPSHWYNWVKDNFTNLSVAFRCEEPMMEIFNQIDPDNQLPDAVWVYGKEVSEDDLSKLPLAIRECAGKDGDDTYYICGTFYRDELFNSNFKPADVPESITVREYTNTTYDALMTKQKRIKSIEEEWRTAYENDTLSEFWSKYGE